jgi:general secretion pathway protein D
MSAQAPIAEVGTRGDQVTLKFVSADVRDVIREVLGETLKLPYVVDPKVQGTITLQTSQPVDRNGVLEVFEDALRLNGIAIVRSDNVYKIVPSGEALRYAPVGTSLGTAGPGYSIQVIPLKFVSSAEIQGILQSIVPKETFLRSIPERNVLLVAGSQREISNVVNMVESFDVDQLKGTSFALLYPKYADAKTVIRELETIFAGDSGNGVAGIKFLPIERINAVLAVSRSQAYLKTAATWFERLDQGAEAADDRVFVYYVQNGRAANLAITLNSLFGGGPNRSSIRPTSTTLPEGTPLNLPPVPQGPASGPTIRPRGPAAVPTAPDEGIRINRTRRPQIIADETNNALLILATPREHEVIQAALIKLDLPPLQVMIEAVVAEVTLNNELRYGVQWFFQPGAQQLILSQNQSGSTSPNFPGFAAVLGSGSRIRFVLDALESITKVNVLSSPQLMVLNNQTATLQVGDQVPIATSSAVSVLTANAPIINTIQFRDTGVILHVTPRVNEGGLVQLDIDQEVSDVTKTTTSGIDSPTIQQRKFNSSVSVQNGQTIALGGLIRDRRTQLNSGVPVLKDIPVLGNLFKNNSDVDNRTELVVLITPRVVRTEQDIAGVTDEFRERLRELQSTEVP